MKVFTCTRFCIPLSLNIGTHLYIILTDILFPSQGSKLFFIYNFIVFHQCGTHGIECTKKYQSSIYEIAGRDNVRAVGSLSTSLEMEIKLII